MKADIGNNNAIEGFRESEEDPLRFRLAKGERVTTFLFPEDLSPFEASQAVIATMGYHMEEEARPVWVEADDKTLQMYLCTHYNLDPSKGRPPTWGSEMKTPQKVSLPAPAAPIPEAALPAPTEQE